MNELKPCPCCGGRAISFQLEPKRHKICCRLCGLQTEWFTTDTEAAEAWNRRPTTELKELDDIPVTACCGIGPITNEKYCPNCGKEIINKKTI